jgi:hypothetical protein
MREKTGKYIWKYPKQKRLEIKYYLLYNKIRIKTQRNKKCKKGWELTWAAPLS